MAAFSGRLYRVIVSGRVSALSRSALLGQRGAVTPVDVLSAQRRAARSSAPDATAGRQVAPAVGGPQRSAGVAGCFRAAAAAASGHGADSERRFSSAFRAWPCSAARKAFCCPFLAGCQMAACESGADEPAEKSLKGEPARPRARPRCLLPVFAQGEQAQSANTLTPVSDILGVPRVARKRHDPSCLFTFLPFLGSVS